jgi:hypothetical protein
MLVIRTWPLISSAPLPKLRKGARIVAREFGGSLRSGRLIGNLREKPARADRISTKLIDVRSTESDASRDS